MVPPLPRPPHEGEAVPISLNLNLILVRHLAPKALWKSGAQAVMIHIIDIGSGGIGGGDRWGDLEALDLGTKVRARGWAGSGCGRGPGGDIGDWHGTEIRREGNMTNKTSRVFRHSINHGVGGTPQPIPQGNGKAKKRGSSDALISVSRSFDPPPATASTYCAVEVFRVLIIESLLHHVDDDRTVELTGVYPQLPAVAAGSCGTPDAATHTLRVDTSLPDKGPAFVDWAVKWTLMGEPFVI
ncbi:unnamed protein product [Tuber aestivum]|uniref:Uncharacterized protein n=1 Tax=Tuber aestivum TaxID=59557 RepID=A0A292PHU6_9PEZI|nr:unnamed protein product [Tuber aestivum]